MWFQSAQWAFLWDVFTRCVFCGVGSFNLTFDECSIQQWYYPAFFAAGSYLAGFFFVTIFHYTIFVFFVQSLCGGLLFALLYMFCILVVMLFKNCISSSVHLLFIVVYTFIVCHRFLHLLFSDHKYCVRCTTAVYLLFWRYISSFLDTIGVNCCTIRVKWVFSVRIQ